MWGRGHWGTGYGLSGVHRDQDQLSALAPGQKPGILYIVYGVKAVGKVDELPN